MLKVATVSPNEPYREYKDVERVYSGSTEIDKILDKNGNVLFAVNKEVEGTPALTYKGKEETNLKNYRIYGQTSRNLFDETNGVVTDTYIKDDGTTDIGSNGDRFMCNRINVLPNNTYTFSWGKMVLGTNDNTPYIRVVQYDSNGNFLSRMLISTNELLNNRYVVTVGNDVRLWDICIDDASSERGQHFEEVMLNEGSTALPYEPYGESVGDRTENLFYKKIENANISSNGGIYSDNYDLWIGKVIAGETYTAYNINSVVGFFTDEPNYGRYAYNSSRIVDATPVYTFTVPSGCSYVAIRFLKNAARAMLNLGDTALPYEPYGYKVPVTVEGKNLFDMKKFAETAVSTTATVNYSENSLIFTSKTPDAYVNEVTHHQKLEDQFRPSCINVHPLTTYTISMNTPYKCHISWIDDSFNSVAAYTKIPSNRPSYTFTTPSNCTKLLIRLGKVVTNIGDTFTISNIMLNEGSTALPYEPYHTPVTTPIYLPEPIKMVGDEAEYIDYSEQKQHRVRKNLLQNTAKSRTINGVTFKINSDGSVTCNGKCVNNVAVLYIKRPTTFYDETIQYTLTGCPVGGAYNSTYALEYTNSVNQVKPDVGNGVSFTPYRKEFYPNACIRIVIFVGYTCDNLTFYPMIRKADIEDDTYEPYIENTELDITLPALPTLSGTNTLSVGTEVQPSNVYLKGRIKEIA